MSAPAPHLLAEPLVALEALWCHVGGSAGLHMLRGHKRVRLRGQGIGRHDKLAPALNLQKTHACTLY
jgi:hypothetical protein